jgi:hypothetical protein
MPEEKLVSVRIPEAMALEVDGLRDSIERRVGMLRLSREQLVAHLLRRAIETYPGEDEAGRA